MPRRFSCLLPAVILLLFILSAPHAPAEGGRAAPDITAAATVRLSHRNSEKPKIFDRNYRTEWADDMDPFAEVTLPGEQPCHTLYVQTRGQPETLYVEAEENGRWTRLEPGVEPFNTHCIPLPGLTHFRIRVSKGSLRIMELRLFGAGELPPDVVNFTATSDKADLMLVACHPDDDILWMGGLMPTYAGQLGMDVQVVYMTSRFHYRRCEAMDAIWHCGVRCGPVFAGFADSGDVSYNDALEFWGGMKPPVAELARRIRRHRPEVLVTHDINGEYGHAQHKLTAAACTAAIQRAADPDDRELRDLPPWQVKKYYIHLYHDDPLTLDMELPLSAFGGKTAFEVTKEAFLLHVSQQTGRYAVSIEGPLDMRRYGLAFSAVGPDERHDGLFEHIPGLREREKTLFP